jgi:carboxypeptidase C (cathepsin A)
MRVSNIAMAVLLVLGAEETNAQEIRKDTTSAAAAEERVVTSHQLRVGSKLISYRATTGTLILRDKAGEPRARMYYVAYDRPGAERDRRRPVTFFFNGGPGSSSLWLHLGSFGPYRLATPVPGQTGGPSFGPNPYSLLDKSDLIFLDAVGTGYSRTLNPADNKLYWGNDEDADAFVEAIGRYLTVSHKWDQPKLLFGESFGTMRAAMLANKLESKGIALSGLVLMSSILNFAHFAPGLDRAAVDLLPSYAATALYHKRIAAPAGGIDALLLDARGFAQGQYAEALAKGDRLPEAEKALVAKKMSALTGLSAAYLIAANLRPGIDQFRRELLRDERQSIGALDTRFQGAEASGVGEKASYDPAEAQLTGAYASAFNSYVTDQLDYRTTIPYVIGDARTIMGQWNWAHQPPEGDRQGSLADSVPDLASAMRRNPKLKILSLNGWYDLMTPFFGTEFDLAHLWAGSDTAKRITFRYYPSGHMIYVDDRVMPQLRGDVAAFYDELGRQ